jgi:carboxypeptidase family protein
MVVRGVVVAFVLAVAGTARAQPTDGFGIERFRLAIDHAALLDVDWAGVPADGTWGAGAWMGFAHDPLVVYDTNMSAVEALVQRRLTTGVVGSYALWNRVQLGAAAEVVDYQTGADPSPTMKPLPSAGLGDVALLAKVRIAGDERFQLAITPVVTVPLGGAGGYLREHGPTFAPELAVSAARGAVRGAANLGYRMRERVATAGLVVDDEAFARFGVGVTLGTLAEVTWSTSVASPVSHVAKNLIAVETLAGVSRPLSPALDVFAAGGLGLDNGFGTPDWRAVFGVRYQTTLGDRDGDGIPDTRDHCPTEPEDRDGFQDDDGCPDLDNDGDGIPDARDRCPNQAEDKDGIEDEDGCPDLPSEVGAHVIDAEGNPIAHAAVTIEQAGKPPVELAAGDDGWARTTLEGEVKLTAHAPEYEPRAVTTHVGAGAPATFELRLGRKVRQGQLRGQVLAFDGKPLAATITVKKGDATSTATAGADGQYTIDLAEGSYEVVIEAQGFVTQHRTVAVKLDGVVVLNVDMRGAR